MKKIRSSVVDWVGSVAKHAILAAAMLVFCLATLSGAADNQPNPHAVPAIDGGIGPCSVEFTVMDGAGAPVYDAKVRVHISYGFLGVRKLDLEIGTNVDGKARFTGLPAKVKDSLRFKADQGDRSGEALYNPAQECTAKHNIAILKGDSDSSAPKQP